MRWINYELISVFLGFFISCTQKQVFTVEGVVKNATDSVLYLENIGVSAIAVLDSVKLKADGKFTFIQERPSIPDFYRLRIANQWINLAIDSTETIAIHANAASGYAKGYNIDGSEDVRKIRTLTLLHLQVSEAYNRFIETLRQHPISQEAYSSEIIKILQPYREIAQEYIYENPASTTAYFALFQQINSLLIFDPYDEKDNRLYSGVATSWDLKYENYPRAKQLHDITVSALQEIRRSKSHRISNIEIKDVISYFEISLPDARGNIINLSDIIQKEKIILLDFTACQARFSPLHNMTLGSLYEKYYDKGLDIFQVSLDADLNFWQNASDNIPWYTVRDPETVYSQTAARYNVEKLPTTFILNRKGEIVLRVEQDAELEKEIKKML
jgi:glutathione peroxidase-family protein